MGREDGEGEEGRWRGKIGRERGEDGAGKEG